MQETIRNGILYDHVHWTIVNDTPLDAAMGTTADYDSTQNNGKIFLVGRSADGFHHNLEGPLTKAEYRKRYGLSHPKNS